MLPVVELGHEYFLVGGKKVIFGLYPGTFDVPDRDEVLSRMAEKGHMCKNDTITDEGFEVAYGYAPYRHDDGCGTRWEFCMLSGIEDIPDDVVSALRKIFPGHPGFD